MTDVTPSQPPVEHITSGELEVVTDDDMIRIAYDRLGIDDALLGYATRERGVSLDDYKTVESLLPPFGQAIAEVVHQDGVVNVELIREAFERFYDGMEQAARVKYGPEKPYSFTETVLQRLGIRPPKYRQHFSRLDDRFWDIQFMEQYNGQTWEKRDPNESEQAFLGRYIAHTLYRFPWSSFSYI